MAYLRPQLGEGEMPDQIDEAGVGPDVYDTGEIGPDVLVQGEEAVSGAPPPVVPFDPKATGADPMAGEPAPATPPPDAAVAAPAEAKVYPGAPAGWTPEDSTFAERQKYMTAQERADWAMNKFDPGKNERKAAAKAEEDRVAAGGAPATSKAAAPEAPPRKDHATERVKFEQELFKAMGKNPFDIDVMKVVNDTSVKGLPALFDKVFKGKAIWQDRDRLDKKQNAHWQNEVKAYRAHVKDEVDSEKKMLLDKYKNHMSNFDVNFKLQEAQQKQAEAAAAKFGAAGNKQETQQAKQEKAIRTQDDALRKREIKSMADIVANMKAQAAATDPKEKKMLQEQHALLLEENADATAARHQFKMQYDKAYSQAWNEKQSALKRRSSAGSPVEGNTGVNPDTGAAPAPAKPTSKPAAAAPAGNKAAPEGGKAVVSERPSKDGSGNKMRKYSDGTVELVHPDGTTEPAVMEGKK